MCMGHLPEPMKRRGIIKKAIYYYEICLDLIEKARGCDTFYYMMNVLTLASVCEKAGLLIWRWNTAKRRWKSAEG